MLYFGPTKWGMDSIPSTKTPIGDFCYYCEEYIGAQDYGVMMPTIDAKGACVLRGQHRECFLRAIIGSVAHVKKHCSCFGGSEKDGDPPNMTKRQAAVEAVREHEKLMKDVKPLSL